jgi:UDP-galactopyranose mutase
MANYSYIIVGAGYAGSVLAERLATEQNAKILVLEKREHIGGNAYDFFDEHGVLIHKYGPHIFHTSSRRVWEYLSRFTRWHPYHHEVQAYVDGRLVPLRINLNSIPLLLPNLAPAIITALEQRYEEEATVPVLDLMETDDPNLRLLGQTVYDKVFLNYSQKQWGMPLSELDASVSARVPVAITRQNGYFKQTYQSMPQSGYTPMFEKILNHPNITVQTGTDYRQRVDIRDSQVYLDDTSFTGHLIYTGEIDVFFDFRHGELPYRSLRFMPEFHETEFYQQVAVVNFPNDHEYTRITEFKHMTGQLHSGTTIIKEYPQPYLRTVPGNDIPYYPIPQKQARDKYRLYREEAKRLPNVHFLGRLAEYKYYDMDATVDAALTLFDRLCRDNAR